MRTAAFLVLAGLASCRSTEITYSDDYDRLHMFGDRLDAGEGVRLLCWPADPRGDRFRFVEDRTGTSIGKQPVSVWPGSAPAKVPAGSVIVILPPDASGTLRERAEALAEEATRGNPKAGRHFVAADASWQDVTGGEELERRLYLLHKRAAKWRETSSEDGIFLPYAQLDPLTPHVIVIPLEGEADQQLVLQGIRRTSVLTGQWEADSRAYLSCDEILKLPPRVTGEGKPQLTVVQVAVGEACSTATRARAMRLSAALLERGRTAVYLRTVITSVSTEGFFYPGELEPPYIADYQMDPAPAE